jgi:crossover junction endodeoxyribonuclease RusA
MTIDLPVPPSANVYWRKYRNVMTRSRAAKAFVARVTAICQAQRITPLHGEVDVELVWYRARKQGDSDNRIKPCLDALQGFAFLNDAQVRKVSIERIDGEKPARMRVTVRAA